MPETGSLAGLDYYKSATAGLMMCCNLDNRACAPQSVVATAAGKRLALRSNTCPDRKFMHQMLESLREQAQKGGGAVLLVIGVWASGSCAAATEGASGLSSSSFDSHRRIPHSSIAQGDGAGILKAKLSCATERYAHGVLGDAIEAGCLVVEDELQVVYQLDLPDDQVFEDLDPRIADIDNDGRNDVVLVRSHARRGAGLSVYTLRKNDVATELLELASTPEIGTSNRWLAPVGIADFNNDGRQDIAYVQTPHIGGILKVWSVADGDLEQIAESRGFSNHSIGSTRVSTARLEDYNDDGVVDMALPDQRREQTVWVTLFPEFAVLDTKPFSESHFD